MADLEIHWPDAGVDRVEAARAALAAARPALLHRPHAEIAAVVGRVLERFRDPRADAGHRLVEALLEGSGASAASAGQGEPASPFSREALERGLRLALERWDARAVRDLIEFELGPARARGQRLRPFACTAVVLGGSIPMPSLLACLAPLLVRSPALVKTASRDRHTAHMVAECLREEDAELGECLAVIDFESDDHATLDAFLAAPCVVASGSDETIAELAARLAPHQRLVGYGHRFSVALIDAATTPDLEQAARALALDAALWDQSGCLSPICAHLVGERDDDPGRFARALADELAALEASMPRGRAPTAVAARIRGERDEAAMRAAAGRAVEVHASPDTAWTVICEDEPGLRPAPLHRFVRVHGAASLEEWGHTLSPHARHLSTVGFAGGEAARGRVVEIAREIGLSRVCELGRMQAPPLDWPHDGQPVLGVLAAWTSVESGT